jgi:hypothetical protein
VITTITLMRQLEHMNSSMDEHDWWEKKDRMKERKRRKKRCAKKKAKRKAKKAKKANKRATLESLKDHGEKAWGGYNSSSSSSSTSSSSDSDSRNSDSSNSSDSDLSSHYGQGSLRHAGKGTVED